MAAVVLYSVVTDVIESSEGQEQRVTKPTQGGLYASRSFIRKSTMEVDHGKHADHLRPKGAGKKLQRPV